MPKRLSYDATDDGAALRYVNYAVREPEKANWKALTADDRVVQTLRALRRLKTDAELQHLRRSEQIKQARFDRDAGKTSVENFAKQYHAHTDWYSGAATFDGLLRQYLDIVEDRVRAVCRDSIVEHLRASLLTLALAVNEHRIAHVGEESLVDTALWARLGTLPWPIDPGADTCTLLDAIRAEQGRRGPARAIRDGFIDFEGKCVRGIPVDVADLLLEVTDHLSPSIARPALVELWKQRTPDLLAAPAVKTLAERQVGSYATYRLGRSLAFLERLGVIARVTDEIDPHITVTDRLKLAELRRRWNEKYFTAYGSKAPLADVDEPESGAAAKIHSTSSALSNRGSIERE